MKQRYEYLIDTDNQMGCFDIKVVLAGAGEAMSFFDTYWYLQYRFDDAMDVIFCRGFLWKRYCRLLDCSGDTTSSDVEYDVESKYVGLLCEWARERDWKQEALVYLGV